MQSVVKDDSNLLKININWFNKKKPKKMKVNCNWQQERRQKMLLLLLIQMASGESDWKLSLEKWTLQMWILNAALFQNIHVKKFSSDQS